MSKDAQKNTGDISDLQGLSGAYPILSVGALAVRLRFEKYHPLNDLDKVGWKLRGSVRNITSPGSTPECSHCRSMWKNFWRMWKRERAGKTMWKNVVNFIGCDAEYEEAGIVLYGAPFDSTTSFRPGTRFAGQAVRSDSYGLEIYSPYQNTELTEGAVYDCGDLELAIGDSKAVLAQIEETAGKILDDGKLPFMIGESIW